MPLIHTLSLQYDMEIRLQVIFWRFWKIISICIMGKGPCLYNALNRLKWNWVFTIYFYVLIYYVIIFNHWLGHLTFNTRFGIGGTNITTLGVRPPMVKIQLIYIYIFWGHHMDEFSYFVPCIELYNETEQVFPFEKVDNLLSPQKSNGLLLKNNTI